MSHSLLHFENHPHYQTIVDYKKRLSHSPLTTFKSYCEEVGVNYRSIKDWALRNGLGVRQLRTELLGASISEEHSDSFVQVIPRKSIVSSSALRGVDFNIFKELLRFFTGH